MSDREEREEHIKRLEAALACEEKRSSGKCAKQTCDDNCALLYEQGNWGEWKETLRYAIGSLKTDLKYDLLYEETSGQADKPTTKKDCNTCTHGDETDGSNCYECVKDMCNNYERTTKIDTINGLDDFIEFVKKTFGVELTIKKSDNPDTYEKLFGTTKNDLGVDAVSRQAINRYIDYILSHGMGKKKSFDFIKKFVANLPPASPQEPRKGEWLRMSDLSEQEDDRYKCSRCGNVIHHKNKMDLYTFNSWCGRCGSDNGRHISYEVEK